MGKLDYLSKYTNGGDGDDPTDSSQKSKKKKHKKKSSSKKSKKKKSRDDDDFIRHYDDDEFADAAAADLQAGKGDDDDDGDDDEGPVVVETVFEQNSNYKKQQFQQEEDAAAGTAAAATGPTQGLRHQQRYDSGDEDDRPRKRRYDSDDEDDDNLRRRYDSDSDTHERGDLSMTATRNWRKRYDSDDDDEDDNKNTKRPQLDRLHYNSNNMQKEPEDNRKRRYDSDDDHDDHDDHDDGKSMRRKRYDSEDEDGNDDDDNTRAATRRRKYDSDDEDSVDGDRQQHKRHRPRRYDSDDENEEEGGHSGGARKERMPSGHVAGLQRARDFREAEQKLQREKHAAAQAMVDKHGMGETVYRDEMGRRVEEPPQQKKNKPAQLTEQEQKDLHTGRVQRLEQDKLEKQWQELKQSSFARGADDDRLEAIRKNAIREGDPMARHTTDSPASKGATNNGSTHRQKPVYKGPQPKPNRFGIRPGYRWDGVDRGNGFEDRVLAQKYSTQHKKETAYRYSSADM